MEELIKWLTVDLKIDLGRIILIMDNSPIHTSKDCMKFFREQNCKIVFLSPYCPQFAAIGVVFNVMKRRLCMQSRQEIINLSKSSGVKAIREVLATFSSENIIKYWTKAMSNISCELTKLICNISKNKSIELHYKILVINNIVIISQGLKFNKSLKFLSLQLNRIDDKGGMKFCQDLKEHNHTLEELNLRGNSLEDMFGRALAELILDTNLKKIDVSCNFIQKKDATSILESLRDNPRIIEFDIRNNKIKDPAVESEINEIVTKNYLAFLKIPYIKSDHRLNLNLDQNQEVKEDQDPKSPEKN